MKMGAMNYDADIARLTDAATRLALKGLFHAGDTLSMRLAGCGQMLLFTASNDALKMEITPLTPHSPDGSMVSQHLAVYQIRPDVGSILLNRQPWARSLQALGADMPGVFDEQVRHLGKAVRLLDHPPGEPVTDTQLRNGANAWVLPQQVLCLGTVPERTVFNAELLEKCAKAYVLAQSTGLPVGRIPWLVRWIANGRLMKDERRAAADYAAGRAPVLSTAY